MFVQEINLDPLAIAAWTAVLLALALIPPVACLTGFERGRAAYEREDYSVALSEFLHLAEQGHSVAQNYLGIMYRRGIGVPQDHALAVQWLRKAADQGHAYSQSALGAMYHDGEGVPRDYVFAYAWANLAAAQGRRLAQELRARLQLAMNPGQIAKAQALSRKFQDRMER